jgi:hypothetical protein
MKTSVTRIAGRPDESDTINYLAKVRVDDLISPNLTACALVNAIVEEVAKRYVEEHYAEIAAKLNQEAIANLAVAESGRKIAEELRAKPTILHEKETRTEVYERGIFGSTRRVR